MTSDANRGVSRRTAALLLEEHGPNELPRKPPPPLWLRFLRQFASPLIYILLFAVAFDVAVWIYERFEGWPVEGTVIAIVLLVNAALGTFQEFRSERALSQLRALTQPFAWVFRDGALERVASRDLVPSDLVRIEAGDRLPADGELVEGVSVLTDESVLTGESVPIEKAVGDELSSGTLLVRGAGLLRVTRTGARSAMGRIATLLGDIETERTPLEKRLDALGGKIARWVGGISVVLVVAGVAAEGIRRLDETVMFAVALAVAAIPEGMPAVVTLALALGVQRMAKRHALVRRLSAVESLGSVTVIATDKTGTLTENRMTVHDLQSPNEEDAIRAMVLANDADVDKRAGDPLEIGLLDYARSRGIDVVAENRSHPRVRMRPFDSAWRYMRVTVASEGGLTSWVKGAPEAVLARSALSEDARAEWARRAEEAAGRGYRVLALARGDGDHEEERLAFLGLAVSWDPPRPEVAAALAKAQRAGVSVVMITGDHAGTARAVAQAIGMPSVSVATGAELEHVSPEQLRAIVRHANVFARVSPEHKLRLIEALEANGEIIAMTGDGVNDAPALKRAAVGIAMGQRGSDVAREAADLVLLDDDFATIVGAIEEGRGIYENIQSFIRFTFSTNVALMVLVISGAVAAWFEGLRDATGMLLLPLTALQLLWINFIGDGPPALALAVDRTPGHMDRPPRSPSSGLLDRPSARFVFATGALKGAVGIALLVVLPLVGYTLLVTQTILFSYEAVAKLVSVYPARRVAHGRLVNLALHAAVVGGIVLQALTLLVPGLRRFLGLAVLDAPSILVLAAAVVFTWAAAMTTNWIVRRPGSRLVALEPKAAS